MTITVVNKHIHEPTPDDVYIGRGSPWGNPFVIDREHSREDVVHDYEMYLRKSPRLIARLGELRDKNLVCFCAPRTCHGDVLKHYVEHLFT